MVKGSNFQNTTYSDGKPPKFFQRGCTEILGQQGLLPRNYMKDSTGREESPNRTM